MADYDYKKWLEYFTCNAKKRLEIDFSEEGELPEKVKKAIAPSVAAFQAGEHSEGEFLRQAAEKFAEDSGEAVYPEIMKLFISEENAHSGYLLRYMVRHEMPKKEKPFLDGVFRKLRQVQGIRSEVMVLVTAEIIALSYYSALGNTVETGALKDICRQMLHDELPHVIFQSYTLAHFKNSPIDKLFRILLMEASCLFVWLFYRPVFTAGGYSLWRLLSESLGYLRQSMALADREI